MEHQDPNPITCRVCLEHGATIPIFDVKDSPDPDVYSKLCQCLGEKIQEEVGFPRHICERCLATLDSAVKFIMQYKESDTFIRQCLYEKIDAENVPPDDEVVNNIIMEVYLEPNVHNVYYLEDNAGIVEKRVTKQQNAKKIFKTKTVETENTEPSDEDNIDDYSSSDDDETIVFDENIKGIQKSSERINPKQHVCKTCGEAFETRFKLRWHRSKKHSIKQKCPHCDNDREYNDLSLKSHVAFAHRKKPKKVVAKTKPIKIKTKTENIESSDENKNNISDSSSEIGDVDFDENMEENDDIVIKTSKPKQLVCKTCGDAFETHGKLRWHRTKEHSIKQKCPHCDKEFHERSLTKHVAQVHRTKQNRDLKRCPHCEKEVNVLSLEKHIAREHRTKKVVANNETFVCETCAMEFDTLRKLNYHRQNHAAKCPHCDKLISKSGLKQHIQAMHSTSKNYGCSNCGKMFYSKLQCKQHERRTHEERRRRYNCTMCEKHLSSKTVLDLHIRSVHTGERPFICEVCGESYAFQAYLKEHMRQHTGAKPYKCPVCGKGHTIPANVKSHLKHNHRISELDDATLESISKSKINYLKHMRP